MQLLPIPCPAHLIPGVPGADAFHNVYWTAMAQQAVFVAIESQRWQRWAVKADTLTADSGHAVDDAVIDAVRATITCLVENREVDLDAYAGPICFMVLGVRSDEGARQRVLLGPGRGEQATHGFQRRGERVDVGRVGRPAAELVTRDEGGR
ncbi:hypothetical protein ACF061_15600 [Streptomyces sp. NPDC015220]|uniref:hypothetical protein n=1 Tax=Streptomyces sp. NPDC015220 TaxID=3364947 RepID=UPI0036F54E48